MTGTDDRIEKTEAEWREALSPEAFAVTRKGATEPPFSGCYWDTKTAGTYVCRCCGDELFGSDAKFDSGSGWPSFSEAVAAGRIATREDCSHGMVRTEIKCARCDGHLGHLFDDGPAPTGKRYCVNSAALELRPSASG